MPRRTNYRNVPDDSDEEENWFGNADKKRPETVNYTANTAMPARIDPPYHFDYGPTPEQVIENVRSLPKGVSRGKVYKSAIYYNVIMY